MKSRSIFMIQITTHWIGQRRIKLRREIAVIYRTLSLKALSIKVLFLLLLIVPVLSSQAATTTVNCGKKTVASEIAKLDKSVPNTVNIAGDCTEDIVVSGHTDLTLIGTGGASLTATVFATTGGDRNADIANSTTALLVKNSRVTVQTLTINGGKNGVVCQERSTCVIRNAVIQGGWGGIYYQDQSQGDILGSTEIRDSRGTGLGIYGASSVNVRPDPFVTLEEAGPTISGHTDPAYNPSDPEEVVDDYGYGVFVLDGSFLRTDNVTISGNGYGVFAARNATIKILRNNGEEVRGEVSDSYFDGIEVMQASTAQLYGLPITRNGGSGVWVGELSFVRIQNVSFSENGLNVDCGHVTSISTPKFYCGN